MDILHKLKERLAGGWGFLRQERGKSGGAEGPGPAAERSFWLSEREKSRGGAGLIE